MCSSDLNTNISVLKPKDGDNDFLNPAKKISENEDFLFGKSKSSQTKRINKNENDNFLNKEKPKSKKNSFLTYKEKENKNKSASKSIDDDFLNQKIPLNTIKKFLLKLSEKYEEEYLVDSYYFYEVM